jgi:hypothetical protein
MYENRKKQKSEIVTRRKDHAFLFVSPLKYIESNALTGSKSNPFVHMSSKKCVRMDPD